MILNEVWHKKDFAVSIMDDEDKILFMEKLYMDRVVILLFVLLLLSSTAIAEGISRYQMNLDHDGKLETIVAEEIYNDDPNYQIPLETKISILESNGSLAAESLVSNGHPKIEFAHLGVEGRQKLVVWTSGGMHYTNLNIFDYSKGKITGLFSNGSACEVEANFKSHRPSIKVGRADRSDPEWSYAYGKRHWNVYTWNGKTFAFDAKKSTTREISEDEAIAEYVNVMVK